MRDIFYIRTFLLSMAASNGPNAGPSTGPIPGMPRADGPTIAVPSTIDQCNKCVGLSGDQCTPDCIANCECNPFINSCNECVGLTTPKAPIPPKTTCPPTACQICQNACNQCVHGQCTEFCLGNCNCNPFYINPCKKCADISGEECLADEFCLGKCNCDPGFF